MRGRSIGSLALVPRVLLAGLGMILTLSLTSALGPEWEMATASYAQGLAAPAADTIELQSPLTDDPRSTILLRYDCESQAGRREVTLFANGTVRLRKVTAGGEESRTEGISTEEAGTGEEVMSLYDLDPDSLDAYRARLDDEDLAEVEMERDPVEGDWVEACALDLLRSAPKPGRSPRSGADPPHELHFRFSQSSALPLGLSRVIHIAEDLIAEVEAAPGKGLSREYDPRPGDVLKRADGVLFKVVDFTVDHKGLELSGVEVPLVIYIAPDELREQFVQVVSRVDSESEPR